MLKTLRRKIADDSCILLFAMILSTAWLGLIIGLKHTVQNIGLDHSELI